MAQEVVIRYKSDLSGESIPAGEERHITLGYDTKRVRLDLSSDEANALDELLKPYLEAGQPVKGGETTQKRPDTGSGLPKEDMKAVRQWWKHKGTVEGFEPKDRGRIPKQVIDAWHEQGKPSFG